MLIICRIHSLETIIDSVVQMSFKEDIMPVGEVIHIFKIH